MLERQINDVNLRSEHISRYQARLKHLDQLLERVRRVKIETAEHEAELKEITGKREELAMLISDMEHIDVKEWKEEEIENAGPTGLWDSVTQ